MYRHLLILLALLTPLHAALIYDNTTTDSGQTVFFSTGPFTAIGDQVAVGGTDRLTSRAAVQFYNAGLAGTFDATLTFYATGSPVGASLFGGFVLAGINAPEADIFTVTFDTLSAIVPNEFVFLVTISNLTAGLDIGLNLYDPPNAAGSSSTSFVVVHNSSFSQQAAGTNSNLFFQLEAEDAPLSSSPSPVPEPSTLLLTAAGLVAAAYKRS